MKQRWFVQHVLHFAHPNPPIRENNRSLGEVLNLYTNNMWENDSRTEQ